jgi:protein-disulfide isomerase
MKKLFLLMLALVATSTQAYADAPHPWLDKQLKKDRYKCPPGKSPFRGAENPMVTITEFIDYDCPYCSDQEKVLKQVLDAYPDKVKLVVKNLPLENLHPKAKRKALVADCLNQQGKFWQAHDRFLQGKDFKEARAGANQKELDAALASGGDGQVDRDIALAKNLGMATTPSFVIDGIRQGGTIGFKQFKALIDAEITRKEAKAAAAAEKEASAQPEKADGEGSSSQ